jgi:hypothetical protein
LSWRIGPAAPRDAPSTSRLHNRSFTDQTFGRNQFLTQAIAPLVAQAFGYTQQLLLANYDRYHAPLNFFKRILRIRQPKKQSHAKRSIAQLSPIER